MALALIEAMAFARYGCAPMAMPLASSLFLSSYANDYGYASLSPIFSSLASLSILYHLIFYQKDLI